MTLVQLIALVANKLAALNSAHATAAGLGNMDDIARLDTEISATEVTLRQLQSIA